MKHLLLFIALSSIAVPAIAQESQTFVTPGSAFQNEKARMAQSNERQAMLGENGIVPQYIKLSIIHADYMEPRQFGLMMSVPDTTTGCFDVSPLEYEANFIDDNYMDVTVKAYRRTPSNQSEGGCEQKFKNASGMIVLSSDDLQSRGVRQIRFTNGNARDNYDIAISGSDIILTPQSMSVFKPANGQSLRHSFDGKTIVALQVPMADNDDNIATQVQTLAASKGLSLISNLEEAGLKPHNNVYYFYDNGGYTSSIIGADGYGDIGVIAAPRPFNGENGTTQTAVPLKVFVTRPDMLL